MQAKDVVWRTVQYDDQKQDLLVSDLDRLRAKEKERLQEPLKGDSSWDVGGESFPSDNYGKKETSPLHRLSYLANILEAFPSLNGFNWYKPMLC